MLRRVPVDWLRRAAAPRPRVAVWAAAALTCAAAGQLLCRCGCAGVRVRGCAESAVTPSCDDVTRSKDAVGALPAAEPLVREISEKLSSLSVRCVRRRPDWACA